MNHKLNNEINICRGYLSDKDYLKYRIPHHQVAIDIIILLDKKPCMQEILRQLIWIQNDKMYIQHMITHQVAVDISYILVKMIL